MIDAAILELCRQAASDNQLDAAILCGLVEQESAGNTWLSRYEPAFFTRYLDNSALHTVVHAFCKKADFPVSFETELRERAFSRGVCQIMGQTAREQGFMEPLPRLHDPAVNLAVGSRFLKRLLTRFDGDYARALLRWNGGGNSQYAVQVLEKAEKYKEHL